MTRAIFVTARTASTRLPNKANLYLYQQTSLITHILKRAKLAQSDLVILCTTTESIDDQLCVQATECNVPVFRGSVGDKLERWLGACDKFGVESFVTMDGDDPFCDPNLAGQAFAQLSNADFIESTEIVTGGFTYAIKTSALRKVCEIKDSEDTEMMWTYFKDTGLFKVEELEGVSPELKRRDMRLTLDYIEDLEMFREIFEILNSQESIKLLDVVKLLSTREDLREQNLFRQSEFVANQANKTTLKLKGKNHDFQ